MYARPQVGAKLIGLVQAIAVQGSDEKVTLVCSIEAELTVIVNQIDMERFTVKRETTVSVEEKKGAASSDDSDDFAYDNEDNDSIFGDEVKENGAAIWYLEDKKKDNRKLQSGSKVKLQITDVQVSEGSIISYAILLWT